MLFPDRIAGDECPIRLIQHDYYLFILIHKAKAYILAIVASVFLEIPLCQNPQYLALIYLGKGSSVVLLEPITEMGVSEILLHAATPLKV
jgi:hypothetical protein